MGFMKLVVQVFALVLLQVFIPQASQARAASGNGGCGSLAELVGRIDQARIEQTVRELSGADSATVGGERVRIRTRFTFSDGKFLAARYLVERIEAAGYEPEVQVFVLRVETPDLMGLAVSLDRDTVWVGDMDGRIYMATAGGGWEAFHLRAEMGQEVQDLEVDPHGRPWAACGLRNGGLGALYLSSDGGSTWEDRSSSGGVNNLNSVAFGDGTFGMAAGNYGTVIRSGDGGETWGSISPGFWTIWGVAAVGPLHYWLVGDGGHVYETLNLGTVWIETQFAFARLFDVDFGSENNGVIVGENVIHYTKDGGGTWHEVSTGIQLRSVQMADSLRAAAVGGGGVVWMSGDGGVTWNSLDESLTGTLDHNEVEFAGRDSMWVIGRNEIRLFDLGNPLSPEVHTYQLVDTIWGWNIVFRRRGTVRPGQRIVLCGHYDSISNDSDPLEIAPGADDNGSGTAGVLEAARVLSAARLEQTVEFVLFDGEEKGLLGSTYFVENLDTTAEYTSVINLDMIGCDPGGSGRMKITGRAEAVDSTLAALVIDTADTLGLDLQPNFRSDISPTSDHKAFWPLGSIPSVLFIEDGYASNPYYHSGGDVADNLDYGFLEQCVKAALGCVAMLAGFCSGEPGSDIVLEQNWPNPFSNTTKITFELPGSVPVELAVFDVRGRLVKLIERATLGPAVVNRVWDGRNGAGRKVSSGIYFLRLRAGDAEKHRKLVLLR